jgi:hypothetical protein
MNLYNVGSTAKSKILNDLKKYVNMSMEAYGIFIVLDILKDFDSNFGTDLEADVFDYYTKVKGTPFKDVDIHTNDAYPIIITFPSGKKWYPYEFTDSWVQLLLDMIIKRVNRKLY